MGLNNFQTLSKRSPLGCPARVASRGLPGACATDGGAGLRGQGHPGRPYQRVPKMVPGKVPISIRGHGFYDKNSCNANYVFEIK